MISTSTVTATSPEEKLHIKASHLSEFKLLITGLDLPKKHDLLHYICTYGAVNNLIASELISFLLTEGVQVNCQDEKGNSPLILASQGGQLAIVKQLLSQSGVKINQLNKEKKHALFYVIYYNSVYLEDAKKQELSKQYVAIMKILITHPELRLHEIDDADRILILFSLLKHHQRLVPKLLSLHVDLINKPGNFDNNALINAINSQKFELAHYLIDTPGIDLAHANISGHTALILAVHKNQPALVQKLLVLLSDSEIEHKDKEERSALTWAKIFNRTEIIKIFFSREKRKSFAKPLELKKESRLDYVVQESYTRQLVLAIKKNELSEVKLILRDLPDLNPDKMKFVDKIFEYPFQGKTAFDWALAFKRNEIIVQLANRPNRHGNTQLILAIHQGKPQLALRLINLPDVDLTHANIEGHTALIWAVRHLVVTLSVVEKLLSKLKIVDITHADKKKKTALDWAIDVGNTPAIQSIKRKMASGGQDLVKNYPSTKSARFIGQKSVVETHHSELTPTPSTREPIKPLVAI